MFMLFYWRNFATQWYSESRILKCPKNIVGPLYIYAVSPILSTIYSKLSLSLPLSLYIYIYMYIYIIHSGKIKLILVLVKGVTIRQFWMCLLKLWKWQTIQDYGDSKITRHSSYMYVCVCVCMCMYVYLCIHVWVYSDTGLQSYLTICNILVTWSTI